METLEAIFTRRSIREYTTQAVPDEAVHKILEAAMQAPSAGNQQPWHFVIITDRKQLNALADGLPYGKMLNNAPQAIVVCADLELEQYPGFWVQDCSNATMNLLLAAHDQGIGAVWVGVYPIEKQVACVKQLLNLPTSIIPLSIIPLGYPAMKLELQESRYNPSRLHLNNW